MGAGGCLELIFMETMDFNLDFGTGFKFVAPVFEAGDFFENRAHLDFGGGRPGGGGRFSTQNRNVVWVGPWVGVGVPPVWGVLKHA